MVGEHHHEGGAGSGKGERTRRGDAELVAGAIEGEARGDRHARGAARACHGHLQTGDDTTAVHEAVEASKPMAQVVLLGLEVVRAEDHAGEVVDAREAIAAAAGRVVERRRERRGARGQVAHEPVAGRVERREAMLQVVEDERE